MAMLPPPLSADISYNYLYMDFLKATCICMYIKAIPWLNLSKCLFQFIWNEWEKRTLIYNKFNKLLTGQLSISFIISNITTWFSVFLLSSLICLKFHIKFVIKIYLFQRFCLFVLKVKCNNASTEKNRKNELTS